MDQYSNCHNSIGGFKILLSFVYVHQLRFSSRPDAMEFFLDVLHDRVLRQERSP